MAHGQCWKSCVTWRTKQRGCTTTKGQDPHDSKRDWAPVNIKRSKLYDWSSHFLGLVRCMAMTDITQNNVTTSAFLVYQITNVGIKTSGVQISSLFSTSLINQKLSSSNITNRLAQYQGSKCFQRTSQAKILHWYHPCQTKLCGSLCNYRQTLECMGACLCTCMLTVWRNYRNCQNDWH